MPPPEQQIAQSPVVCGASGPAARGATSRCVVAAGGPGPSAPPPPEAGSPPVACSLTGARTGAIADASIGLLLPPAFNSSVRSAAALIQGRKNRRDVVS